MEQVRRGTYDRGRSDQARSALFSLCETDPQLSRILGKHAADRQILDELYSNLIRAGAGQWARDHFVPASAFAFGFTLEYILEHKKDEDFRDVAWKLVEYFDQKKRGPVE
jgi:hypothetical protein